MLNSMTGFARQTAETPFGILTLEIRAVNHRYLDVQFRLPEELRAQEAALRARVGEALKRGKVECALHLRRDGCDGSELSLNEPLIAELGDKLAHIAATLPKPAKVSPMDVLRWPGVVTEPDIDTDPLFEAALALLDETLAAMGEMRRSEGQRIADMLESRLAEVLVIADSVRKRLPAVLAAVRDKQQDRIDKLDVEADPARLETELALIAQKLDVDEELDRLASHVDEVRTALDAGEPVGRRLDFLMQELNREANTLGSKSADAETTRAAVDLKVLIEQMREQVQNVE